uniref:Uncharacterized protein n=1 Tax=Avena sativa TaxID=4498 RepID=A0ACD5TUL9_AVESA
MAKVGCFCALLGGNRKKSKDVKKVANAKNDWQKVKPVECMDGTHAAPVVSKGSVVDSAPAHDAKVVAETAAELACQGHDGDGDRATEANVDLVGGTATDLPGHGSRGVDKEDATSTVAPDDVIVSGAVGRALPSTPSSRLQRSCSNIETARRGWKAFDDMLPPAKSRSHDDLVSLPAGSMFTSPRHAYGEAGGESPASSVRTTCSADRVMLKRRSSSQVLPSRSRKLWWRLFLWSHRNLHRLGGTATSASLPRADWEHDVCHSRQHDGYTSDTLGAKKDKEIAAEEEETTAVHNQWVAFSAEASSSLDRVSAWVSSSLIHAAEEEEEEDGIVEIGESSGTKQQGHVKAPARRRSPACDAVQASSIVRTLNAFSTVAHVSGMGLKVIPMISAFSGLRAVNLSNNLIAHISPGSLPKGLHALDLSRNNIGTIEGLRDLTRLRVLSLSYNRISRIGHGNQPHHSFFSLSAAPPSHHLILHVAPLHPFW